MNNNNSNSNKNSHHHQPHQHHHYANEFSLFVGDLPENCSDDELQNLFQSKFKSVKRVQIIRHEDGKSRGFGFIRFEDRNDFQAALSQEMRIGNKLLRLDTAHRSIKNRTRYPSINSSSSNSSHQPNHHPYNSSNNNGNNNNNSNNGSGSGLHHHHQHHHNQSHHHQQHHHQNQSHQHHLNSAQQQKPKTLAQDQLIGSQQSHHSGSTDGASRVNNSLHHGLNAGSVSSTVHHHSHAHHHQQHNPSLNAHMNHNLFGPSQQKNSQHQQTAGARSPKQQPQSGLTLGGDDATSQSQTKQSLASPQTRPNLMQQQHQQQQPSSNQPISQVSSSAMGLSIASGTNITSTSTSAVTSMSNSESSSQSSTSGLVSSQANIAAAGPSPIAHDYRSYPQAAMLDNPHLMGPTDPSSVVPPSSVYGHIYPYGPPSHFGYMPPPQPNPVIPISAGPPLPPNQGSSSTGVGPHPIPTASSTRYGNAPHQQHHHPQAHLAGVPDTNAINTMNAGVQASHQAPFYYYSPYPFYFDQSGAGAPPNMYHPQTLHHPFFALPNPAYMPNAHTYTNQQQTQPPTASQSEATTTTLVNQTQLPQPPQSHQQQVNIRTRDIDAPVE